MPGSSRRCHRAQIQGTPGDFQAGYWLKNWRLSNPFWSALRGPEVQASPGTGIAAHQDSDAGVDADARSEVVKV
jgi:hypothetical protein